MKRPSQTGRPRPDDAVNGIHRTDAGNAQKVLANSGFLGAGGDSAVSPLLP